MTKCLLLADSLSENGINDLNFRYKENRATWQTITIPLIFHYGELLRPPVEEFLIDDRTTSGWESDCG